MEEEGKMKKIKKTFFLTKISPGLMVQTPRAGTGDSVG